MRGAYKATVARLHWCEFVRKKGLLNCKKGLLNFNIVPCIVADSHLGRAPLRHSSIRKVAAGRREQQLVRQAAFECWQVQGQNLHS